MEYQKRAEATGYLIGNKIADAVLSSMTIKLQKSQEVHHRIVQKHLQMSMIKKCLKKDIYL